MIILEILKIIGIVLACIVGFVLLILLLVLLTPITYRLQADGNLEEKQIAALGKVKWLAGFVTAGAEFQDKNLIYYVKLAGIKIIKGDLSDLKKSDTEGDGSLTDMILAKTRKEYVASPNEITREDIVRKKSMEGKDTRQIRKEMEADIRREEKEIKDALKAEQKKADNEKKIEKQREKDEKKRIRKEKSLSERFEDLVNSIREKYNKALEIYNKIKTVKYIIGAPVTKRALKLLKKQMFKILGSVRPRYLKGNVGFSLGDPANTALAYGAGGTAASFIDQRFVLTPYIESDKTLFEGDIATGGRIFAGYIVICGIKIILNKDVRRVIKYTRKHLA